MGRGTCHGSPETGLGGGWWGGQATGFTRKEDLELQERNFLVVQWLGSMLRAQVRIPVGTEIPASSGGAAKKLRGRIIIHVFCLFSFFFFFLRR